MKQVVQRIYERAPVWLQTLGINAYGLMWRHRRYGGRFRELYRQAVRRESFDAEQWRSYQTAQLRSILSAAWRTPHFHRILAEGGWPKERLGSFRVEDLPQLPFLEKEMLRSEPSSFLGEGVDPDRLHVYSTSGSTGTPLDVVFGPGMHRAWSAIYEARCRKWAGLDRGMKRATFGGRVIVPARQTEPPFWRYNAVEGQLYLSAFHVSPATAQAYVQAINRYKPEYIAGYAASTYLLARLILEQGLEVRRLRAAVLTAEKLTAEARSVIEDAFRCEAFDQYGNVEACCLASECEEHRLHVSPDIGIVEVVDEAGRPVEPGETGEIVATGLLNRAQPLIRYRTGDRAVRSEERCPCGRSMPVLAELVGRLEDVVVGPDGRQMVRFHGIFYGLPHVREGQVVQESMERIRLRLVTTPGFSDSERSLIRRRFEERLGRVRVEIEEVDSIERTERGKFRAVVSHIDPQR